MIECRNTFINFLTTFLRIPGEYFIIIYLDTSLLQFTNTNANERTDLQPTLARRKFKDEERIQ